MNPPLWGVVGVLVLGLGPWGHLIFHPDKVAAQAVLAEAGIIKLQALGESGGLKPTPAQTSGPRQLVIPRHDILHLVGALAGC